MIATIVAAAAAGAVAYNVGLVHATYQIMDADEGGRERIWASAEALRDSWHEFCDKCREMTGTGRA